jgi:spermidine/putrescine transport system substrate-binding protein
MRRIAWVLIAVFTVFFTQAYAAENSLNVYAWSGEVPDFAIQQFEKETGIKVNFSTYDSNEVMYAKLKADKSNGYDLVIIWIVCVVRTCCWNWIKPSSVISKI